MHQDIIDALNLAGRRRGYDDGGMVADEMMSDDPTQQFMANLARAGFTQDQINSIIGSQSPQTNQTPSQQIQMPQYQYIPNQPAEGSRIVMNAPPSAQMGDTYGAGMTPFTGQPITEYADPFAGDDPRTAPWNINNPMSGGPNVQYPMGGTGTKAGGSAPMGGGMGGQMTPEEWSRTYGPNVEPDPRMIRQSPSQGNLGGALNTLLGGMGGGAPIQGAYGNPQYAPLGGGSKAGGPASPFAPNMPGGYGAPPPGYFPHRGDGNPFGGAGHKGGGAGHKGGGGGGMFGG